MRREVVEMGRIREAMKRGGGGGPDGLELWLLEDEVARGWAPFSETRPVGELLFGVCRLRERVERALGMQVTGYLGRVPGGKAIEEEHPLEGFSEGGSPPVLTGPEGGLPALDRPRLLLSSRAVLASSASTLEEALARIREGPEGRPVPIRMAGEGATPATEGGAPAGEEAGWLLPPGTDLPTGSGGTDVEPLILPGSLLQAPWDLVAQNGARLSSDLSEGPPGDAVDARRSGPGDAAGPADGVQLLGDHPITFHPSAQVDPQVVLDAREGPIHLAEGVKVHSFSLLRGPVFVGSGSTILGGLIESSTIGPVCKIRGEVADAVITGWSNKAHDGYLGHALLGAWVNLGAGTTNSDLKNNYGTVRVPVAGGQEVDTGLIKVGVFLGDHVKTGIGTLLTTGSVVGVGSNLFVGPGGPMPPRWVPPFSWGSGVRLDRYDLLRFLQTTRRVMGRRGEELDPGMADLLKRAWERTHGPSDFRLPGEMQA